MGRLSDDALTPNEAKFRLRVAADRLSPSGWVRRKPGGAVLVSLLGGLLLGTERRWSRQMTRAAAGALLGRRH